MALQTSFFVSIEAMLQKHAELRAACQQQGITPALVEQIEKFIIQAQATGRLLDDGRDRRTAQSLLNYWASLLDTAGRPSIEALLDEFDPELAPEIPDERCPYPGLNAFDEHSHDRFFGRQTMVERLLKRLGDVRLLAVVGPSGSGKSSLVRAGLLPPLRTQGLNGEKLWIPRPLVPGSDPLTSLLRIFPARSLALKPGQSPEDWHVHHAHVLRANPQHLADLLAYIPRPTLLVIDQFEELFTLVSDDRVRRAFLVCLVNLVQDQRHRHIVIVTMRTEFVTYIARFAAFHTVFEQGYEPVMTMSRQGLREAIERPAALAGLRFEPPTVERLVDDLAGEPSALPLLQSALLELWRRRQRNHITFAAYQQIGGGRQALAHSADAFYRDLPVEQQEIVREIFLKMIRPGIVSFGTPGDNRDEVVDQLSQEFTSYRVPLQSLTTIGKPPELATQALDKLAEQKLVRLTRGEYDADIQIEIAHEALVRHWPLLGQWLAEKRDELIRRQRFRVAANRWLASGKDPALLLPEPLVEEALLYEDRTPLETDYMVASRAAIMEQQFERERRKKEHEAAHERELNRVLQLAAEREREMEAERQRAEAEHRRAKEAARRARERDRAAQRLRLALTVVAALFVVALGFANYILNQNVALEQQRNAAIAALQEADAQRQAVQTAQKRAENQRVIAETAAAQAKAAEEEARMQQAAAETSAAQARIAEADSEARAATARAAQQELAIRSTAVASQLDQIQQAQLQATVSAARQLPGRLAAKAETLIGLGRPQLALRVALEANRREHSRVTEDALQLAIQANTKPLRHATLINSAAWSPNNLYLLTTGNNNNAWIWDVRDPSAPPLSLPHPAPVTSASWSSDGARIVTTSTDGIARIWDVAWLQTSPSLRDGGKPTIPFVLAHGRPLSGAAWSHDGTKIVTSSGQGLQLWNAKTGQAIGGPFGSGQARVGRDAWDATGTLIITSGDRAQIWNVSGKPQLERELPNEHPVLSAAWNPARTSEVATGDQKGKVQVWNWSSGALLLDFQAQWAVNSVAWSSSGRTLLAACNDGKVYVYFSGAEQATLAGGNAPVMATSFSPDRRRIVAGSADGAIRLYYVEIDDIRRQAEHIVGSSQLSDGQIQAILEDRYNDLPPEFLR